MRLNETSCVVCVGRGAATILVLEQEGRKGIGGERHHLETHVVLRTPGGIREAWVMPPATPHLTLFCRSRQRTRANASEEEGESARARAKKARASARARESERKREKTREIEREGAKGHAKSVGMVAITTSEKR